MNDEFWKGIEELGGPGLMFQVQEEFRKGVLLEQMKTQAAVQTLSETPHKTSRGIDGLGHISADIPADVYFNWNYYEPGFWGDDASRRWFLNKNPQFKVKYEQKAQIAWKPAFDRTQSGLFIGNKYGAAA